jgi:hypothetical protein
VVLASVWRLPGGQGRSTEPHSACRAYYTAVVDPARIEAVLGYVLAVAAQADDWRHRELGPIHLLKYLYLADLAYAKKHCGEPFTGTTWTFYKFGPWSQAAHALIEPSLQALRAQRRTFPSRYREDDAVRWSLSPESVDDLGARVPAEVALPLARVVCDFGDDTAGLLQHVYRTWPMLNAAPGDVLDLKPPPKERPEASTAEESPRLSRRKVKKLRKLAAQRLAERKQRPRLLPPDPPPRYDELWEEAMAQLESPLEPAEGVLRFADSVWHSPARRDPDLS